MPTHTAASLTSALSRTLYWTDSYGTIHHYNVVRTQADVIRELHYKLGSTFSKNLTRYLTRLVGSGAVPEFAKDWDISGFCDGTRHFIGMLLVEDPEMLSASLAAKRRYCGVVVGHDTEQYTAIGLNRVENLQSDLWRMLPSEDAAAVMVAQINTDCEVRIKEIEASVAQTKELLVEERARNVALEKVIVNAGVELPTQCMCGNIRCLEDESEVLWWEPRKVVSLDEETGELVEEYETSGGEVELWRQTWFHHFVGRTQQDEVACRDCVLGNTADKGKCSPCFDPTTTTDAVIGVSKGKSFEFRTPSCYCCAQSVETGNCFAWNKNRYLVVPQLMECVKELVPRRKVVNGTYESIAASEVLEVQMDKDIPVARQYVQTQTTRYYGTDYNYEAVNTRGWAVRPIQNQ